MSDLTVHIDKPALIQPPKANRKNAPQVTGKLVIALKAIVWEGQELQQAATLAGLTTHAVRLALSRPHVIAFLKAEREVLRQYVSAQNIHHVVAMRESGNAMAALGAMKLIEQMGTDNAGRSIGSVGSPGLTIQIINSVSSTQSDT